MQRNLVTLKVKIQLNSRPQPCVEVIQVRVQASKLGLNLCCLAEDQVEVIQYNRVG